MFICCLCVRGSVRAFVRCRAQVCCRASAMVIRTQQHVLEPCHLQSQTLSATGHLAMVFAFLWTSIITRCFFWIGVIFTLIFCLTLARGVWRYFLRPGKDLRKLGSWAVVTGATDGIGRALCDVLARKGTAALQWLIHLFPYSCPCSIRLVFRMMRFRCKLL